MSKPGPWKAQLLIVLVAGLGLTTFIGYRMSRPANPAIVQAGGSRTAAAVPSQSNARIRLDLLDRKNEDETVGDKNLFQYGQRQAPLAAPPAGPQSPQPQPQSNTPVAPAVRPQQPPPPIPLKYVGFAFVEPNSKALIATLLDDSQRHFNAVEGDVYLGRYRVARITETTLEVEDLEFNRRQTLALVTQ